nr:MAG TPA: hypothetical protein [Caudoviricetes sp.]
MILILIATTASVAVYLAICLGFLGSIVSDDGLLNHIPQIFWADASTTPTCITSWCYAFYCIHSFSQLKTLIKKWRRIQHTYYYRMYFVHNFSLFISEGKKIILRMGGADALHQMIIAKEDGLIPIIIGAGLPAYFLGVQCSRLLNG